MSGSPASVARHDDARRRTPGHGPVGPPAGRPVRPRERPLAGDRGDPRRPVAAGAPSRSSPSGPSSRSARSSRSAPARRRAPRRARRRSRSATSGRSFMDEDAHRGPRRRADPGRPRAARRGHRPRRAGRLHRRVRAARRRRLLPAPTSTPTTATPTATWSTCSRAASACPTSPTTATRSSPRSATAYVAAPRADARRSPASTTPRRWPQQVVALETRLAEGHWERAETRDVIKAYNLTTFAELQRAGAGLRLAGVRRRARRRRADAGRGRRPPAQLLRAPLDRGRRGRPSPTGRPGPRSRSSGPRRRTSPARFVEENFDFYGRTLSGTPELRARWKRGVGFVEGCVGEAVGQLYVERHFPPASKARDGRAGRQPASRPTGAASPRSTG